MKNDENISSCKHMKFSKYFVIFAIGFLSVVFQTLLFREYLGSFESNDIAVGVFFGTWLFWIALSSFIFLKLKKVGLVSTCPSKFAEWSRMKPDMPNLIPRRPHSRDYEGQVETWPTSRHFELLFLLTLPAFIIQFIFIIAVRNLAGIESYELFSLPRLIMWSSIVNIPVSFIAGMLFPLACEWISDLEVPVAKVYATEACGFFIGGVLVTLMLAWNWSSVLIFLICAIFATLAFATAKFAKNRSKNLTGGAGTNTILFPSKNAKCAKNTISCTINLFLLPLAVLICLIFRVDQPLMEEIRLYKWTKLLPANSYQGSFHTAQAEYLYGTYNSQWTVVKEGAVCETIPEREGAGRKIATVFAQNPKAENILLIGSGLNLCRILLEFPNLKNLYWSNPDKEYMSEVNKVAPEQFRISDSRFHPVEIDVMDFLRNEKKSFDMVIINVGNVENSFINRFFTGEFYRHVKLSSNDGGTMAVRISSGENVISPEEAFTGASVLHTIGQIFPQVLLVPGEDSWFIASVYGEISGDPELAIKNFSSMTDAEKIFPPEVLRDIYQPDRAKFAVQCFENTAIPENFLLNTEARPAIFLAGLMLSLRQAGTNITGILKNLLVGGTANFAVPFIVFILLWFIYKIKSVAAPVPGAFTANMAVATNNIRTKTNALPSSFENIILVLSSGIVSMGTVIVLMYLYQSRFGSLFLNIGMISAAFMAGLTAGAIFAAKLVLRRDSSKISFIVLIVLAIHVEVLLAVCYFGVYFTTGLSFALVFALNGLINGFYFPCASKILVERNFGTPESGAVLESADSFGAVAGALFSGILLVPIAGTDGSLLIFALIILVNFPLIYFSGFSNRYSGKFGSEVKSRYPLRKIGYVLFGIAISTIISSHIINFRTDYFTKKQKLSTRIQNFIGDRKFKSEEKTLENGSKAEFFRILDKKGETEGFVFKTADFASDAIPSFGGRINIVVKTGLDGKIEDFKLIESSDSPEYIAKLGNWFENIKGSNLFSKKPLENIDTVSGATYTSRAVLDSLRKAGHNFYSEVIGGRNGNTRIAYLAPGKAWNPNYDVIYILFFFVLSVIVARYNLKKIRYGVLLATLLIGGFALNCQFSTDQIFSVINLNSFSISMNVSFLLGGGLIIFVMLFGNLYCGFICPFGALQELVYAILPKTIKNLIPFRGVENLRIIKYVLLFTVILLFVFSGSRKVSLWDPLISFFSPESAKFAICLVGFLCSVICFRFWCRFFCPAGAFLSLFAGISLLKWILPPKIYAKCPFGIRTQKQLDCIYCNECLKDTAPDEKKIPPLIRRFFIVGMIVFAVFLMLISLKEAFRGIL